MENRGLIMIMFLAFFVVVMVIGRKLNQRLMQGALPYDERQKLMRGISYQYAFYTLVGFLVLSLLVNTVSGKSWCSTEIMIILGLCLATAVYCISCIWKDAYVAPRMNVRRAVWITGVIGIINITGGVMEVLQGRITVRSGTLVSFPANLIVGITLLLVDMALVIRVQREKQNQGDTEEQA